MSIPPQHAGHVPEERNRSHYKFDDDERIRSLTEAQAITADIPEERITHNQSEQNSIKGLAPIHMGEFLRTCVSRRLSALSEGEFAAFTAAVRQLGVDSQGGPEALAIFHRLLIDEWAAGTVDTPLAGIK